LISRHFLWRGRVDESSGIRLIWPRQVLLRRPHSAQWWGYTRCLRLIVGTASDIRIVRDDASVLISSTPAVAAPSFVGHSMREATSYRTMRWLDTHDIKLLLSGHSPQPGRLRPNHPPGLPSSLA
jgi:hypothetical protein